jgi:AAA+ superfamily predicted ATPase
MLVDPAKLFESKILYPHPAARERLNRLVGLDEHKKKLTKVLGLLVNQDGLHRWAKEHHSGAEKLLDAVISRPPLVILAGDVGSGKTELAETIGDAVGRQEGIDVMLLPLSLATRGQGKVGEMTHLISTAFDYTVKEASTLKSRDGKTHGAVILLVDEADALAQSRETSQMHHEDVSGVNAFIRGIDRIANQRLPAAVIMCTNRYEALDPAVKRRAAEILTFGRPDAERRHQLLDPKLRELGF